MYLFMNYAINEWSVHFIRGINSFTSIVWHLWDGNAGSSFFSFSRESLICAANTKPVLQSKKGLFCCHGLLSNPPDNIHRWRIYTYLSHSEKKEQEKRKREKKAHFGLSDDEEEVSREAWSFLFILILRTSCLIGIGSPRFSCQRLWSLGCLRNFVSSKFRIFRMFFLISYTIRKWQQFRENNRNFALTGVRIDSVQIYQFSIAKIMTFLRY